MMTIHHPIISVILVFVLITLLGCMVVEIRLLRDFRRISKEQRDWHELRDRWKGKR